MNKIEFEFNFTYAVQISLGSVHKYKNHSLKRGSIPSSYVYTVRVHLARKVKNLLLVTIDVYRPANRKIEVCRVSGCGGPMEVTEREPGGGGKPSWEGKEFNFGHH